MGVQAKVTSDRDTWLLQLRHASGKSCRYRTQPMSSLSGTSDLTAKFHFSKNKSYRLYLGGRLGFMAIVTLVT